ncbi:hypothetical protein OG474_09710 [Kribbella sp. NBC_01505]|uniref:hypothetical protein n=1 Tax=Kribbella sp. NBC_01505 TaxID=2903580 RepID=UPI0038637A2F
MARKSQERLIDDAAGALREYYAGGRKDADLLKAAAADLVELRSRFTRTADGLPDWSGHTGPYRTAVGEIYSRAGLSAAEREPFRKTFAYWVRLALDDRGIPSEELTANGIKPLNPKARQTKKRTTDAAIAATFAPDTTAANRVVFAERLLAQAAGEDIAALAPSHRQVIRIALDNIAEHTENLRGAVAGDPSADAG